MSFIYGSMSDGEKRKLCLDLLSEFGVRNLREADDELIHSCALPFGLHRNGDAHPSASLNWDKLTFRCLGCGARGGILWFIATMRGEETHQSRDWLSKRTGIGGIQGLSDLLQFLDSLEAHDDEIVPMPRYDQRILEPWKWVHPWLVEERHIRPENIVKHLVGWNKANKIVIPHFWGDDLVGWQERRIFNDGSPKYKSTPDFPRDRTIYNYDPKVPVMLVESPMSVVARTHQAHLEATFGGAVTIKQMGLIERHPEVVLFFDNDQAGWSATKAVGEWLMQRTSKVWVVDNPYKADPADLSDGVFEEVSRMKIPFVVWSPPKTLRDYTHIDDVVAWTEPPF